MMWQNMTTKARILHGIGKKWHIVSVLYLLVYSLGPSNDPDTFIGDQQGHNM